MSGTRATAALRFLGWLEPIPSRRPRPAARPRPGQPPRRRPTTPLGRRMLIRLGLAEPQVVVSGHPRIRQRVLATLEQRRRSDRVVTAGVAALLVTALLGIGVVRSPLLAVETVSLVGLDQAQREAVADVLGVRPGTNVLDVDLDVLRERAEALPWVSVATARRRLPSTVEVRVAVSRPVAAGVVGQTLYLLDATGTAVEAVLLDEHGEVVHGGLSARSSAEGLPRLALTAAPTVGQAATDPHVRAAAAVAAAMPVAVQDWITGYRTGADGVEAELAVATPSGPMTFVARIGRAEDVRAKAATLAAVVDEALTRGMRLSAVDLRIPDRPVVRS